LHPNFRIGANLVCVLTVVARRFSRQVNRHFFYLLYRFCLS